MDLGAPELLIILLVALVVLGPTQLPKLARSLGEAVREFRHGSTPEAGEGTDASAGAPREGGPPLA